MGLLGKLIKAPLKLHKKATKAAVNVAKKTTPGMGGGGRRPGKPAPSTPARSNPARPIVGRPAPGRVGPGLRDRLREPTMRAQPAPGRVGPGLRDQTAKAAVQPMRPMPKGGIGGVMKGQVKKRAY